MKAKPTSAKPRTIHGVTFRCYKAGVMQTHWISDDDRCRVGLRGMNYSTYYAFVDDKGLGKKFRKLERAMEAAVKEMNK